MLPDDFDTTDKNRLAYCVVNAQTGERQDVYFAPLRAEDEAELRGPNWSRAVYREFWPACMDSENTLKLVCADVPAGEILGIVRIGTMMQAKRYLRECVLEAAPSNWRGTAGRKYAGVGRVSVARLVAESYSLGGAGKLLVEARPGSEKFYAGLGFRKGELKGLQLSVEGAEVVLASALR